jgi:pimeloyl-ACP methyl ester carboxylesterase
MLDFDQLVSDCVAWIRHAKTLGYERIYLAGHSQGSLIAMLASKQESVDGVISLAGAGFPIDITLERQLLEQLDADSEEFSVIRGLREGRLDPSMKSDSILSLDKQEFLLTWMKYDPSTIISSLPCPALILQGSVDLQVDDSEFDRLTKASPQSLAVMIENMNHVLKPVRSEKENLSSYSDPAIAIEPRLVDAIATFVQ